MTASIRIEVLERAGDRDDDLFTEEALAFLTRLHDQFASRRGENLRHNHQRQVAVANGRHIDFLPETASVREEPTWRVAGAGPGLDDRRVEITGPTDRKMTVNALNSGAKVWLADGEDALSPTWRNVVDGQANLFDAIRRQIDFTSDEGKQYRLDTGPLPTIVFRPRGWHLVEKHLRYTTTSGIAQPASASLVDFGLYFFHNAKQLMADGAGPYFYLPKLESHQEARLWDEVFTFSENAVGLPHGSIRATVLIETIWAAFEMEEILWELKDHCAGLNAGRWDYLFSIIKTFRERGPRWVLPDRSALTMTVPFMRAYTELLVSTCHRRGAHAIGGMSAFIPNRRDPEVTERALAKVADDKRREAGDGFDGTWVAHPDLIPVARAEFDAVLGKRPNQVDRLREDVHVTGADLVTLDTGGAAITDAGVATNVSVGLRYLEAWLRGQGAVAIDNLMEDAATAEISRSQLWQWIHQGVVTAEGTPVTREQVLEVLQHTLAGLPRSDGDRYADAADLLVRVALEDDFPAFFTTVGYAQHFAPPGVRPLQVA